MNKKDYLAPLAEQFEVRTEMNFATSLTGVQSNVGYTVEGMDGYDADEYIDW